MTATAQRPVLLTGAGGFLAFHVAERLLRRGTPVVGLDTAHDPTGAKARNAADLLVIARSAGVSWTFERADVRTLAPSFGSTEPFAAVVHLAGKASLRQSLADPTGFRDHNAGGTLRVLAFAAARGVDRLVVASSSAVYGPAPVPFDDEAPLPGGALSPYAESKREAERLCFEAAEASRLRIAVVRPFNFYGERMRADDVVSIFTRQLLSGEPLVVNGPGTRRDFTYVGDTARGVVAALDWTSQVAPGTADAFNLGTGAPTSLDELVRLLEALTGRPATRAEGRLQPAELSASVAATAKAARVLGFRAEVPLRAGLTRALAWLSAGARP